MKIDDTAKVSVGRETVKDRNVKSEGAGASSQRRRGRDWVGYRREQGRGERRPQDGGCPPRLEVLKAPRMILLCI